MDHKTSTHALPSLARVLVLEGLLDEATATQALDKAKEKETSFESYLIQQHIVPAPKIAEVGAKNFGTPLLNLDTFDKSYVPMDLINDALVKKYRVLPLMKCNRHVYVAISDPTQENALKEITFKTGLIAQGITVETNKLDEWIDYVLSNKENETLEDILADHGIDDLKFLTDSEQNKEDEKATEGANDAPIVRFVNKILLDAIKKGASDIHFEPYEKKYRVRFRLDGLLHEIAHPPVNLGSRVASRLKVMSELDISERRIPQDGRFKMQLSKKKSIDFRVSTCPTVGGEKIVMRILDPSAASLGIESLGFNPQQKKWFLSAIQEPQGMILVTGPTGSGKTITLYSALTLLNTKEKNTSTAEDPVEIKLAGINQVNINTKAGLTFSSALRSFLRQDPDIIMVGEMRDLETAEIGVKAAQTGHLVLSTLHTNSAPETLTRLLNMGIPSFNIATSTNLIIAQRLARRLCNECKKVITLPKETLIDQGFKEEELDSLTLYGATGCEFCIQGYKGRAGLFELLKVTEPIAEYIMEGKTSIEIAALAKKEGMQTLRGSALEKVREGITSLEEINRVIKG